MIGICISLSSEVNMRQVHREGNGVSRHRLEYAIASSEVNM